MSNSFSIFDSKDFIINYAETKYNHEQRKGMDILRNSIAPGAFHNSAERFDPPKCAPSTRVAVIKDIMTWVEELNNYFMWLYGPLGTGKSAIAQSIAELCADANLLAASFFFSRTAVGRNDESRLIPTLVYQLCMSMPAILKHVEDTIERDPLVLSRSLEAQIRSLMVDPLCLAMLNEEDAMSLRSGPKFIIIDGLDECGTTRVQRNVLAILATAVQQISLPISFLIISRPELTIRDAFLTEPLYSMTRRLALDYSSHPYGDIERFFQSRFDEIKQNHPLRNLLPPKWPSNSELVRLVQKSSGHFIYAATVMKHLDSPRRWPPDRLDIILGLSSSGVDTPFADLDALYMHIFSTVDDVYGVLEILNLLVLTQTEMLMTPQLLENIFCLRHGDVYIILGDLHSIMDIPAPSADITSSSSEIHIFHASLKDFLLDKSRSGKFYIDAGNGHASLTRYFLRYLSKTGVSMSGDARHESFQVAEAFTAHCPLSSPTPELLRGLYNFDFHTFITAFHSSEIIMKHLFYVFDFLKVHAHPLRKKLYSHHVLSLEKYLKFKSGPILSVARSKFIEGSADSQDIIANHVLITAEGALQHVSDSERKAEIKAAFHDLHILDSQYFVLAGFNEALIQSGFGYLEEVHLFCCVEITDSSVFLRKLGKVLTPYPGVVFTPSSGYKIPVFKDDGTIWDYDDFTLHHAKRYTDVRAKGISHLGLNAFTSLAENQPSSSIGTIGRLERGSKDNNSGGGEGEDHDHSDDPDDHDHEKNNNPDDNKPEDDPDSDPEDDGDGNSLTPCITFEVQAKLFVGSTISSFSKPFQELEINGALVIQTDPAQLKPRRLSKSQVEFKKLKLQGSKSAGPVYEQVHVWVEINTNDENTKIDVLQPAQTPAFNQATKETRADKVKMGGTLAGTVGFIKPTATVALSGSKSKEASSSTESTKYHSRITERHLDGFVSWGFSVDDTNEREVGIEFGRPEFNIELGGQRALPIADFEFYGPSDDGPPPPPPEHFDVLVQSCWSPISPHNESHTTSGWLSWFQVLSQGTAASEAPLHSNLCQAVILKAPSHLSRETLHRSVTEVTQSSSNTTVKRQGLHEITSTVLPLDVLTIGSGSSCGLISSPLRR